MGIRYDEVVKCWRLDRAVSGRGGKSPTHIRRTVRGPKQRTQAQAMRLWLEINERAAGDGSLTFGKAVEKYLEGRPHFGPATVWTVNHLKGGLGDLKKAKFLDGFRVWIEKQSHLVAPATVRNYILLTKAIWSHSGERDLLKEIKVGKAVVRRRPIAVEEILRLEEAIEKEWPWFLCAFRFALTNPVRPGDQFGFTVEQNVRQGRIEYVAHKTKTRGYPIPWPELQEWLSSVTSGLLFPDQQGRSLLRTSPGSTLPAYRAIWAKVRRRTKILDVKWYDLKHHAVAYCRSHGVPDWRIVRAAGWSSVKMLDAYDPDNTAMINAFDDSTFVAPKPTPAKKETVESTGSKTCD